MKDVPEVLLNIHDATLIKIEFDWASHRCVIHFSGAPNAGLQGPFTIVFNNVSKLVVPAKHPWGHSSSVFEVRRSQPDKYVFVLQSGDEIMVTADEALVANMSGDVTHVIPSGDLI